MSIGYDELEALITVVNTGSFRAASEQLHKAQSSISYAIKSLEKELNIEIFNRNSYRPKLTKEGELIYNKAKNMLRMQNDLVEFASNLKSGVEPEVSLVVSVLCPTSELTEILKDFKSQYPQTQIKLSLDSFDGPIKQLLDGDADMIIATDYKAKGDLDKLSWQSVEYIPVCSPNYPAADPHIPEASFSSFTQVIVGDRSLHADETKTGIFENSNTWYAMDFSLKKKFLIEELGWGYMPKELIEEDLENGTLVKIPQKNITYHHLYMFKEKSDSIGPATSYLWDLLKTKIKIPSVS